MSDVLRYALVAITIYLTHVQEGITGFGCTVLALPFITLLLGLDTAVPMLVLQAWVLTFYIAVESRNRILWSEYARILVLAGIGLPIGMLLRSRLPEDILKWILAAFMVLIGIHGLVRHINGRNSVEMSRTARIASSSLLPIGGLIHGMFGSGGPLAVIYAARALPDKTAFRGTLCAVWVTLNTILIGGFLASQRLDAHVLKVTAFAMPFTLIGMVMGNRWHYTMDETLFRKLVYIVLSLAGVALALSIVL